MKTLLRIVQTACLIGVATTLGGCVTYYKPGTANFEMIANERTYGLVRYVHPGPDDKLIKEYCAHPFAGKDPLCAQRQNVAHVYVAIGRNGWGIKVATLLVLKSEHVQAGDVIEFQSADDNRPYNRFIRLAARAADTDRLHCGWVGSKIAFSGGVVCDGWRYDRDYPLLAN